MTTATPPRQTHGPRTSAPEPRSHRSVAPAATRGWYDPDGAGWEADPADAFEAFEARRATTTSPIRAAHPGDEDA